MLFILRRQPPSYANFISRGGCLRKIAKSFWRESEGTFFSKRFPQKSFLLSRMMVTGPSFVDSISMWAWKRPCLTATPESARFFIRAS